MSTHLIPATDPMASLLEKTALRIDFVSDVACPWCAVGLNSLEKALQAVADEIPVELHFQPFELNPTMAAEGADAGGVPQGEIRHGGRAAGPQPRRHPRTRRRRGFRFR